MQKISRIYLPANSFLTSVMYDKTSMSFDTHHHDMTVVGCSRIRTTWN